MEHSKNQLVVWLRESYDYVLKYKKEAILIVGGCLALIALGVGYSFYRSGLQKKAQKSFAHSLKFFDAVVNTPESKQEDVLDLDAEFFTTEKEKWTKVESEFKKGYQNNKSSGIAPFFLAHQAEALVNLGRLSDAIDVLKNAVKMMDSSSTKTYYEVKLALMKLDSGNPDMINEGLNTLKTISLEERNSAHAMVLYRLGEHFWYAKNNNEAKNYWNQLVLKYGKTSKQPSWWAQKANQKLKLISSK